MFTLIEVMRDDWNVVGLSLSFLSDIIFVGALYWSSVIAKNNSRKSG